MQKPRPIATKRTATVTRPNTDRSAAQRLRIIHELCVRRQVKWEASFLNLQRDGRSYARVNFVQVAMLRFDGRGLITHLEEYWTSKGKYGKGERGESKRAAIRAGKRKPPKAYGWLGSYAMR